MTWGALTGLEIGATTSEFVVRYGSATTNGQWTTSGVNFTQNEWKYVAMLMLMGGSVSIRLWTGTSTQSPLEIPITASVTPAGTLASNANFYLGNRGTSTTQAFQGDIGNCWYALHSGTAVGRGPLNFSSTANNITDDEASWHYQNYVMPVWRGNPSPFSGGGTVQMQAGAWETGYFVLDHVNAPRVVRRLASLQTLATEMTVNGATQSAQRSPNPGVIAGMNAPRN